MTYIIADHLRLATEMAQQYRCRVYVLGVVGVVECPAREPQWVQALPTEGVRA